jgi:nitronate monooxygenase
VATRGPVKNDALPFSFGSAVPHVETTHSSDGVVPQSAGSAREAKADVHRLYRQRVLDGDADETVCGTAFDEGWPGVPHRVLENDTVSGWEAAGRPETGRPGAGDVVAEADDGSPIRRYEDALAVPGVRGAVEELPLYAGQSSGLIGEVQPARELVGNLTDETVDTPARVC